MSKELEDLSNENTRVTEEKRLQMMLARFVGNDDPELTENQIDKIIEQRGEAMKYTHEDKKRESKDNKAYFFGFLIFLLILAAGIFYYMPDYIGEYFALVAGLMGGGGFGYSIGVKRGN